MHSVGLIVYVIVHTCECRVGLSMHMGEVCLVGERVHLSIYT